ncbi:hypothetical protein KQX54_014026 [Cotesia glomerata]|uniref:SWIM-type domain-containing protein n=1 Tax=Cotesia glomerata TaxID=32391 RepID=A0AAV7HD93_COTGL|nr:hypothetical protein KQX54_014026 [Cotesia glomerata]
MNKIIKVGFEKITHSIDFHKQKIINGKKLSEDNVVDVEELRVQNQPVKIKAKIIRQTNTTEPPYQVELKLNAARHVINRSCTCVSQACAQCKHIYALIYYINKDTGESKTSEEQSWGKPSSSQLAKEIFAKPLIITDEFSLKKIYGPVYDVQSSELEEINCSFQYVLKFEKDFAMTTSARMFIEDSASPEWFSSRKYRISASQKAHSIKTNKKKDSEALADNLAVEAYIKQFDVDVVSIGVFVKPLQSWLCASVDGIVIKNDEVIKILEIKCPSTCASKPVFDEKEKKFNVKYLELKENEASLKKSHVYYTQCQVQMYVVGLNLCDLFIWSPKGSYVVTLKRDEKFLANLIPKLKLFYFNYYLKVLVENQKENI